mmetsp:Transcript_52489/g.97177  ORF Transcript_52489/g.97177 Transcript_52489/m.97177 type:complete len:160 (-) Transcript_52489:107-586(-)
MGNACCCEETGIKEPMAEITAVSPMDNGFQPALVSPVPRVDDNGSKSFQLELVEDVKQQIAEDRDQLTKPLLEVIFATPEGTEKRVFFEQKPLGMDFRTGGFPITIQRVKGPALEAGVESGWVMKSINGEDVNTPDGSFDGTMTILKKCLEKLPRVVPP